MLLAIDVGNTNVVFALFERGSIRARWRIATDPRRTAEEYVVWLTQLLAIEGLTRAAVTRVIIATVVPRALHNLELLAGKYFGIAPWIAGEAPVPFGITIAGDTPRALGADRAVNAVAAHARYPGDLIVIDFGTAITIDAIDASGAYRGGIIAPGVNLSLDALVGNTAKLPRIAIATPRNTRVIGTNTEDQMLIGIYWGCVAMIEGLVARMRVEIGRPVTVVATGGLAVLFNAQHQLFDAVDPDLTLEGLALLAARAEPTTHAPA